MDTNEIEVSLHPNWYAKPINFIYWLIEISNHYALNAKMQILLLY